LGSLERPGLNPRWSEKDISMVGALLMRGMLVGVVAAILSFGFLKIVGEPAVDRAIAFETAMDEAKDKAAKDDAMAKGLPMPVSNYDPELVSRPVQAGIGLLTGVTVYNVAFGGLFALVFALCYRRMGDFGPRTTAALLAISGIVAVYLVPNLKYPANPPSVGDPDTIGMRTGFYFAMIAISLAAMIGAWMLRNRLAARYGGWNAALLAGLAYLIVVVAVALALPAVNEVPEGFPANVLWQFRMASVGAQLIMWATIGLAFGALTERAATRRGGAARLKTAAF
jgi:predicted cobalt transporter CbtA